MRRTALTLARGGAAFLVLSSVGHAQNASPLPGTQPLARADALADVDQFFATYEADHPAPYVAVSRDSVRRLRAALAAALPDTLDAVELWRRLAPIVGALGDGHTGLGPPSDVLRAARAGGTPGPMPLVFTLDADDALLVQRATSGGAAALVPRGARVLRVNGLSMDSLYAEEAAMHAGTPRYRHYAAARALTSHLWLRGVRAPYTLDVLDTAGAAVRRVVLPSTADVLPAAGDGALARSAHLAARVLPARDTAGGRVGYLNFFSFEAMAGAAIEDEVTAALAPLAADSVRTLVIDLRYNGGGNSGPADALLSHVADHTYRFNAAWSLRLSADVRRGYGCDRIAFNSPTIMHIVCEEREGSVHEFPPIRTHWRSHEDPFFRGPVCVLIGPGTYSSAAYAADAIRTYNLATVVGEETGGRVNDWTGVVHFALAHSGLPAQVSTERTVRANGNTRDQRGVLPHITVVPTAADVRAGRDPVIERAARECPVSPPRGP